VMEAATLRDGGCNPRRWRLQPSACQVDRLATENRVLRREPRQGKRGEAALQLEIEIEAKEGDRAQMEEQLSAAFGGVIKELQALAKALTLAPTPALSHQRVAGARHDPDLDPDPITDTYHPIPNPTPTPTPTPTPIPTSPPNPSPNPHPMWLDYLTMAGARLEPRVGARRSDP